MAGNHRRFAVLAALVAGSLVSVAAAASGPGSGLVQGPQAGTSKVVMHRFKHSTKPSPRVGRPNSEHDAVPNQSLAIKPKPAAVKVAPPKGPQEGSRDRPTKAGRSTASAGSGSDLTIFRNVLVDKGNTVAVSEPTVANDRFAGLYTANFDAWWTGDNGLTWTERDPNQFFDSSSSSDADKFCCDQSALAVDRDGYSNVFWLLQGNYEVGKEGNHLALVTYKNANDLVDNSFCQVDIFPSDVGWTSKYRFDFPHMAATDEYLYISVDVWNVSSLKIVQGTEVLRMPLSQFNSDNCEAATLGIQYEKFALAFSATLAPGNPDTMYWAYLGVGSAMAVFSWDDGRTTYDERVNAISSFPYTVAGSLKCTTSDGHDPCNRAEARISSGFYTRNRATFIFGVAQNKPAWKFPHTRVERFTASDLKLKGEYDWYNDKHAVLYGAIRADSRGDAGGIYYRLGGDAFQDPRVFLIDSKGGDYTTPESLSATTSDHGPSGGTTTPSDADSWGDYSVTAPYTGCGNTFHAGVYALRGGSSDSNIEQHFVWFGRADDACPDVATTAASVSTRNVKAGDTVNLSATTESIGAVAPGRTYLTHFYLSHDTDAGDPRDIVLPGALYPGALAPGASRTQTLSSVTIPSTAGGTYYVIACADDTKLLNEITRTNNCAVAPTPLTVARDFSIGKVGIHDLHIGTDTGQTAGSTVRLVVAYHFVPAANMAPTAQITIYLTPKLVVDDQAIQLAKLAVSTKYLGPTPIPVQESLLLNYQPTVTPLVTIPQGTTPGVYHVIACPESVAAISTDLETACTVSPERLWVVAQAHPR